jgi:hypothetical protein
MLMKFVVLLLFLCSFGFQNWLPHSLLRRFFAHSIDLHWMELIENPLSVSSRYFLQPSKTVVLIMFDFEI